MSIIKICKSKNKLHPNNILTNAELTLSAKGLAMMYLCGDGFSPFTLNEIMKRTRDQVEEIEDAFLELNELGLFDEKN